jgi:hypothetical protein
MSIHCKGHKDSCHSTVALMVSRGVIGISHDEEFANARLIAAAPELLAIADQAANGTLLDDASNHDDDSLRTIAFRISDQWAKRALLAHADRIDAAIAKATGESQ